MSTYFRSVSLIIGCSAVQILGSASASVAQFANADTPHPPTAEVSLAEQPQGAIAQSIAQSIIFSSDGYVPPNNGGPDYSQGSGTR